MATYTLRGLASQRAPIQPEPDMSGSIVNFYRHELRLRSNAARMVSEPLTFGLRSRVSGPVRGDSVWHGAHNPSKQDTAEREALKVALRREARTAGR